MNKHLEIVGKKNFLQNQCGVEEEQVLNEHKAPEATNEQSLVSLWLM